jgi:hypothetical protein
MSKSLVNARGAGAWSVSEVVFDLNDMLDDEGRPISERRADAVVRAGVEMEMRECPFGGIREGHLMNVSALAQISRYFNDAMAEMSAFRRAAGADATWDDMLVCIVDLLSQPAIYLLQRHSERGPVPARMAVCHKLAAGFFGVLRGLHERLALGAQLPLTVDRLLELVDEMGALLGASEACAGSPAMIRKACTALIEGEPPSTQPIEPARLAIARCLALQVQLGIFWHLYDQVHVWSLVRGEFSAHLTPRNNFLAEKLAGARNGFGDSAPPRPDAAALPRGLDEALRRRLADALDDATDPDTLEQDVGRVRALLEGADAKAIRYDGEILPLALRVAHYLNAQRLITAELSRLEYVLRGHLGFPAGNRIHLGAAVFPIPQALTWYELIVGSRAGTDSRLAGLQRSSAVGAI